MGYFFGATLEFGLSRGRLGSDKGRGSKVSLWMEQWAQAGTQVAPIAKHGAVIVFFPSEIGQVGFIVSCAWVNQGLACLNICREPSSHILILGWGCQRQGPAASFGVPAASLLRAHYAFYAWGLDRARRIARPVFVDV